MKRLHLIAMLLALLASPALAGGLELAGYQQQDGAITVANGGDTVEPYFANKALLTAHEAGIDISIPGREWVRWAIAHQEENGDFMRYCRKDPAGAWEVCGPADSDDATLALWLELLYTLAPPSGLPEEWQVSAAKAEAQLKALHDPETGVYHISPALRVGLLMDNVEIYNSLRNIARAHARMGDAAHAAKYRRQAAALAENIQKVFWQEANQNYRITTQERSENSFYPDKVAQIYPALYKLPSADPVPARENFHQWMLAHKEEWLKTVHGDYPWGLVAVAALRLNDADNASCWAETVEPFRYSKNWNVLEEAAFQHVERRLQATPPSNKVPCVELS